MLPWLLRRRVLLPWHGMTAWRDDPLCLGRAWQGMAWRGMAAVNLGVHERSMSIMSFCRSDIKRLWKVAGQRFTAPKQQIAAAVGPEYSLWHVSLWLHQSAAGLCLAAALHCWRGMAWHGMAWHGAWHAEQAC